MTRKAYIEQIRRLIYGGQPNDDATIGVNLVNVWLDQSIAFAAQKNYTGNIAIDGISYVNNSFYTVFKGITPTSDEQFLWKVTLPQIPVGIGENMGVSTIQFKDATTGQISQPVVWLTENQRTFYQGMRPIPNKLLGYQQGQYVYVISTLLLNQYTASVTMVSGGDSTDLNSTLNVPPDYFPVMTDYLTKQLMFERQVPVDLTNDGTDVIQST